MKATPATYNAWALADLEDRNVQPSYPTGAPVMKTARDRTINFLTAGMKNAPALASYIDGGSSPQVIEATRSWLDGGTWPPFTGPTRTWSEEIELAANEAIKKNTPVPDAFIRGWISQLVKNESVKPVPSTNPEGMQEAISYLRTEEARRVDAIASAINQVGLADKALAKILKAQLKRHLAKCVSSDGTVTQDESWSQACECCRIGEAYAKAQNLGVDFLEKCGIPAARAVLRARR